MVDLILPKGLPSAGSVPADAAFIMDNGSGVFQVTAAQIVAAAPVPSVVYATLGAFKAAPITNKAQALQDPSIAFGQFNWETANAPYTADNINIIKADSTALSVGAWVRQSSAGVAFKASGTGAVTHAIEADLRYFPNTPARFGAVAGADSTTALQAMIDQGGDIYWNDNYISAAPLKITVANTRIIGGPRGVLTMANGTVATGLAILHGATNCSVDGLTFVGKATTEAGQNAIRWNARADGAGPYHLSNFDAYDYMGGSVTNCVFIGFDGSSGWNTAIDANWVGGFKAADNVISALYGTASNYGYGIFVAGPDALVENNRIENTLSATGRHGIYISYCARPRVLNNRVKNFTNSGIAVSTAVTDRNDLVRIMGNDIDSVASLAQSGSGGIEVSYQDPGGGPAVTRAGIEPWIINNSIRNTGAGAIYIKKYDRPIIANNRIDEFSIGAAGVHGIQLIDCPDALLFENGTRCSKTDTALVHIEAQTSARVQIRGGTCNNTGSGQQRAAVRLNTTGSGTPNSAIERVVPYSASGSWAIAGAVENGTQGGSSYTPLREGAMATSVATGADITLDATFGESHFILNSGATSILQILPAKEGQRVTLSARGATTIKVTNFYLTGAANVSLSSHDTITLVCVTAAGASSLWEQAGYSSNH